MTAQQKRNVIIISAVAIGINVLEAFLVSNVVDQKFDKNWKFKVPDSKSFLSSLFILVFTSSLCGLVSETLITQIKQPTAAPDTPTPPQLSTTPENQQLASN